MKYEYKAPVARGLVGGGGAGGGAPDAGGAEPGLEARHQTVPPAVVQHQHHRGHLTLEGKEEWYFGLWRKVNIFFIKTIFSRVYFKKSGKNIKTAPSEDFIFF